MSDKKQKIEYNQFFAKTSDPFNEIKWNLRNVEIKDNNTGKILFNQNNIEAPEIWSDLAVTVAASKYFKRAGVPNGLGYETSIRELITRIADSIVTAGIAKEYFKDEESIKAYNNDLKWLLLNQYAAFNSPVNFNAGLFEKYGIKGKGGSHWYWDDKKSKPVKTKNDYEHPQLSACFIMSVEDDLEDIFRQASDEAKLYKFGSGVGLNASTLRSKYEKLSGGGNSSGVMSYLKHYDSCGGVIKSGGICLAPNQKIYTENGPIAVKNLINKDFIVLSYDPPSNRFKAKNAKAWIAGEKEVLRITTDKGIFETSFDHPFKLSSNEFIEAKDLLGKSLFDCNIINNDNYPTINLKSENRESRRWDQLILEDIYNENLTDLIIHHIDKNKYNNSYTNLQILTPSQHAKLHNLNYVEEESHNFYNNKYQKNNHRVLKIESLGVMPVYDVEVNCPTLDDKSLMTGHNFVIWSNDNHFGTGVVVANTRRSAALRCLNDDHPEVLDFIDWKLKEEKKALALIAQGYDSDFNGEAYETVSGQNTNLSVRLSDKFMEAYEKNGDWETKFVTTGEKHKSYKARKIFNQIAKSAHFCADPGVQYHDITQDWNTCADTTPINATNPCGEYAGPDNTSCNLASLNINKFFKDKQCNIKALKAAIKILIIAQDIIVDLASYPTELICVQTHKYRALGLGISNLGSLLMTYGLPYDSENSRILASYLMAFITGQSYKVSTELGTQLESFESFNDNRNSMWKVINKHLDAVNDLSYKQHLCLFPELVTETNIVWDYFKTIDKSLDITDPNYICFRNSQVTLLAPTGTISFLMDCSTTGIEPEFALVKVKKLAGGGDLRIVNNTVTAALLNLGYTQLAVDEIESYIFTHGNIEGSPYIKEEHYPIFDCASKSTSGTRVINYMGHINMIASLQPFISGAISKTVNVPNSATVEDIENIFYLAWKKGIKGITIYRDGSKGSQPLNTSNKKQMPQLFWGQQKKLPSKRPGWSFENTVQGQKIFVQVGEDPDDNTLSELFIRSYKSGSSFQSILDAFCISVSLGTSYGVPLEKYVNKFKYTSFSPSGFTDHKKIRTATSILDFVFKMLEYEYLNGNDNKSIDDANRARVIEQAPDVEEVSGDPCSACGGVMNPSGGCKVCTVCGASPSCG